MKITILLCCLLICTLAFHKKSHSHKREMKVFDKFGTPYTHLYIPISRHNSSLRQDKNHQHR